MAARKATKSPLTPPVPPGPPAPPAGEAAGWRAAFDAVPDLVFLIDRERRIVAANAAAAERFGLMPGEMAGRCCTGLVHPDNCPPKECPFERMLVSRRRETMIFSDGARPYEVTCDPLFGDSGQLSGAVHTMRDITERSRREEARFAEARRRHDARRIESLTALASGVAHDFNNLLTAVLGNAELASFDLEPGSPLRPHLDEIRTAATRAATISRRMLAYTGRAGLSPRELDLVPFTRDALAAFPAERRGAVRLRFEPEAATAEAVADPEALREAISILLENAVEAIPGGVGEVTVRVLAGPVGRDELEEARIDGTLSPGTYAILEVADDGAGMDEATRERIFDPFFSTKFIGRGLGLPSLFGMMRAFVGGVRIRSAPGEGTSVRLYLPAPAGVAHAAAVVPPPPKRSRGALLIVDDEPTVLRYAGAALSRLGFRVVTASGGAEALEKLARENGSVVAAIVDLVMPFMDGAELCRAIRESRPDLPLYITSGYAEAEVAPRFADLSIDGFLEKPFQLAHLEKLLSGRLGR